MTCPLDAFDAPTRAYGLHQLLTSYGSGPLIEVAGHNHTSPTPLVLYPGADLWIIEALVAAYALTIDDGIVYVKTLYDQSGNGADCAFASKDTGAPYPPFLYQAGQFYRIIDDGVSRPAMLIYPYCAPGAMSGGDYSVNPSGKRFLLHGVVSQMATDPVNQTHFPPAGVLIGQTWSGTPPVAENAAVIGYGGGSGGDSSVTYDALDEVNVTFPLTSVWRNLSSAWTQDVMHVVSTRRKSDVALDAFADGTLQQALTLYGNGEGASPAALFNTVGTLLYCDAYRCTEVAHWQSDPGAIQTALYTATIAAFNAQDPTVEKYQISLKQRSRLPEAKRGVEFIPSGVSRLLNRNPPRR